uniref:Serine protease 57 n=1 Tax=Molossus molossus TaxID=27622 RepID=A0A7J8IAR7_MOLMO|nr:serine protease 57 [Molossus molossus]
METEVRVLGLDVCNSSWRGQLSPAMICTHSGDRRRRGFCSADSGGPLVCRNRAHGLVSFSGLWCGDPKTPDVYTQVSAFMTWIWDVVRQYPTAPGPDCHPGPLGPPLSCLNHSSAVYTDEMTTNANSSGLENSWLRQGVHRAPNPGSLGWEWASVPNKKGQNN